MKILDSFKLYAKKMGIIIFCMGFLAFGFLPGQAFASPVIASGTVSMDWAGATLTGFDSQYLSWLDPTLADTRSSFSSAVVTLNGVFTDPGDSDAFEGGFVSTSHTASLTDAKGSATGTGATGPVSVASVDPVTLLPAADRIDASSSITLNQGPSSANVLAQAALTGQFTVTQDINLSLLIPYTIDMSLSANSGIGQSAFADALFELDLYNFDTNELYATGDVFRTTLDGLPLSEIGSLSLVFSLVPGITYDFVASASTSASAFNAVPEPGTLLLLGGGLIGLGVFQKKFRKSVKTA